MEEGAPSTTAIRRMSPRTAEALMQKPASLVEPVLMPSQPAYRRVSRLVLVSCVTRPPGCVSSSSHMVE